MGLDTLSTSKKKNENLIYINNLTRDKIPSIIMKKINTHMEPIFALCAVKAGRQYFWELGQRDVCISENKC